MYSILDIFDDTFTEYRAAYFFNKHFRVEDDLLYGLSRDNPWDETHHLLEEYLRTEQCREDEEIFLAVMDKIYQWCLENLPNLRMFFEEKLFSLSFLDEDKIYLNFLEYYITDVSSATTFLKTEWEKGVDEFLMNFAHILCIRQWNNLSYATDAYRISKDYEDCEPIFEENINLLLLPYHKAPYHDYLEGIIRKIYDPSKKMDDALEADPWFGVYVSTLQTIECETSPFVGNRFNEGSYRAQFDLKVSIPSFPLLTVTLSRMRYDYTSDDHSCTLSLDAPDFMNSWRGFFSTWRMETLRSTKYEYLEANEEYERLVRLYERMMEGADWEWRS